MPTDFKYFDPRGAVPINTRPMQEAANAQAAASEGVARAFNTSLGAGLERKQQKDLQKSSQGFQEGQQDREFKQRTSEQESRQTFEGQQNDLSRQNALDIASTREMQRAVAEHDIELRQIAAEERRAQSQLESSQAYSGAQAAIAGIAADPNSHFFQEQEVVPFRAMYADREPEEVVGEISQQFARDNPGMPPEEVNKAAADYVKSLQKPRKTMILPAESHEALHNTVLESVAGKSPTRAQQQGVIKALDEKWGSMPHDADSATQRATKALQDEFGRNLSLVKKVAGASVSQATRDREARADAIEKGRQQTVGLWDTSLAQVTDPEKKAHLETIRNSLAAYEKAPMSFISKMHSEWGKTMFPVSGANAVKSIPQALTAKMLNGTDAEAQEAATAYVAPHLNQRHMDILVNGDGKIRPQEEQQRLAAQHLDADVKTLLAGVRKAGGAEASGQTFEQWKAKNAPKDSGADYDLRGAFKAGVVPDADGHMPDTFKKPNHPTFSVESEHVMEAPTKAGYWRGDTFVKPAPDNLRDRAMALRDSMRGRGIPDADVAKTIEAFLKAN